MRIEISFDDCNISDLKAARLMAKHGFSGTFYMPSAQVPGTQLLTLKEIKEGIFDLGHEIGGHTVSHPMDMKLLDDAKMKFEVENNMFLCSLIMKRLPTKFCYPRGRHDERVRAAVRAAGYLEARTTVVLKTRNDSGDPFQTPTTIHMFPREDYNGVHWLEVARAALASAVDTGGFFSLWGHSKELDRQGDWEKFEEMLVILKSHVA